MQIAIIGLGKMGGNMAKRLMRGGHDVFLSDRDNKTSLEIASFNKARATVLPDFYALKKMQTPRAIWVMVPSGQVTETVLHELSSILEPQDVIIDGGNSNFRDSVRHAEELQKKGIRFIDAGTSGGIWGLENGYCLMVGGDETAYKHIEPVLRSLAPKDGLAYLGRAGAGHFAKMVHNGIEYAMMQAYAEGFELLQASEYGYDLAKLSQIWNQGSVVRSWLLELAQRAFQKNAKLEGIGAYVDDSGEGRWTVNEAVLRAVPVPTIAASLFARFTSRQENSFAMRVLSALRNEFGGHAIKTQTKQTKDTP